MNTALYKERLFESRVLRFICYIGLLWSTIVLFIGIFSNAGSIDFITDLGFVITFLLPIILLRFSIKYQNVLIAFCTLFLVFLTLNWIGVGGLKGTAEYSLLAGLGLFIIIMRDKRLLIFVAVMLLVELALLYSWESYGAGLSKLFNDYYDGRLNYLFISLITIVIAYYAKSVYNQRRKKLRNDRKLLETKQAQIRQKAQELESCQQEHAEIKQLLEEKVNARARELEKQNRSMEEYLKLSMNELVAPFNNTLMSIDDLKEDRRADDIIKKLISSGGELELEVEKLKSKLNNGKNGS